MRSMRSMPLALVPLLLLAGCAGQLRDYVGPVSNITSPQLLRFGLGVDQARCVGERMGEGLRPRQLRMFARAAGAVRQGFYDPARLTFRDLMWVANAMGDGQVPPALRRADAACGVTAAQNYARETAEAAAAAARGPVAPAAAAPAAPTWLNLGAAGSGQSIAIDASTISQEGNARSAWFRLTDPGAPAPSADTFLLNIDCAHRTINARTRRRHGAGGAVAQQVDYPDNPLAVEGGTVMEIAWLSLCT
jgi:hypothetical protein